MPLSHYSILQTKKTLVKNHEQRHHEIITNIKLTQQTTEIEQKLMQLMKNYDDIFHLTGDSLQTNNFYTQNINLTDNVSVYVPNYKQIYSQQTEINSQIAQMLDEGIIAESVSHFNSPILLVPKIVEVCAPRGRTQDCC